MSELPEPLGPAGGYRILIDVQGTQGPFNDRGVAKTVAELSCALIRIGAPVVGLLMNPDLPPTPPWFAELVAQPTLTWATASEIRRLEALGPMVCLLPSPMEGSEPVDGVWPPFLSTMPFVPLIHDAIPYADPLAYDRRFADLRLHATRPYWLDLAAHTLATTRFAAQQWESLVGPCERGITPVGMGVSPFYKPAADRDTARRDLQADHPAITKPFVLYVGGDDARKNVDGAIRAWARVPTAIRDKFQFVIACSASATTKATWSTIAAQAGLQPSETVFTGFVSESTLRLLYQTAELHFFASHSEGFGMPIVEGIACGCPAISSNTTSMPEVVGWDEALFDPTDIAAMAALLARALSDRSFQADLQATCQAALPRHSWDGAAHRIVDALSNHLPSPPRRRPVRARRLAIVAPPGGGVSPPSAGVGSPLNRLLNMVGTLDHRVEIDLFGGLDDAPSQPNISVFPVGAFGRTLAAHGYDERIYLLPNDAVAAGAYDAACRWPGVVWLVDDTLSALVLSWGPDRFNGFLDRWYHLRAPSAIRHGTPNERLFSDHGMLAITELAHRATRFVVRNDAVRAAVLRELVSSRPLPIDTADASLDVSAMLVGLTVAATPPSSRPREY